MRKAIDYYGRGKIYTDFIQKKASEGVNHLEILPKEQRMLAKKNCLPGLIARETLDPLATASLTMEVVVQGNKFVHMQ
jgi:hypothetical protein